MLRRRRCNTTSSNTTSVPTSSLGGCYVCQLPPQDGDHFFPLSSNQPHSARTVALAHDRKGPHCMARTYTWHLPTIATGRTICGGCLNEVDRVHQIICSLPECMFCPQRPPPDGDRFFQTLKHGRVNVQALLLYCSVTAYLHQQVALPPYDSYQESPWHGGFPDRHLTNFPNLGVSSAAYYCSAEVWRIGFAVCQMPEFHGQHASYVS